MDNDLLAQLLGGQMQGDSADDSFRDFLYRYMHALNQGTERPEDFQDAIFHTDPSFRKQLDDASYHDIEGLADNGLAPDLNITQSKNELQNMFKGNSDYLRSTANRKSRN